MQLQMPPQSAPPLVGSHVSLGSSTHLPAPGQGLPVNPPQLGPEGGVVDGTQAHTEGEESKVDPFVHNTFSIQEQMPPQSAPPVAGSHESLGLSTHLPMP